MARGDGRTRVIPFLSLLSLLNKGRYEEWGRRENDRDRARQTEIDKETDRRKETDKTDIKKSKIELKSAVRHHRNGNKKDTILNCLKF